MPVISLTITSSPIQRIAGIPLNISLETNIPATIFYTLDGTTPTASSTIAIGIIELPTDQISITLNTFATNGIDTSAVITRTFGPNIIGVRQSRDKVYGLDLQPLPNDNSAYFGNPSPNPDVRYGNVGGITVDEPGVPGYPVGYDGTATNTPAAETDKPYNLENYEIKYSERTVDNPNPSPEVGTLPAYVKIIVPPEPKNYSDANSKLFDPRALVIIQDGRNPPEDQTTPMINRQFFSMNDRPNVGEKHNGIPFNTSAFEGNPITGTFLKPHYNSKDDTWIFPYHDRETNQWIFSIEPVQRTSRSQPMTQVLMPQRTDGERKVFRWIPFKRSRLR